jgi:uncharacterized RDD family membrane protein YckC
MASPSPQPSIDIKERRFTLATTTYAVTSYELADIGTRFIALFIDSVVLSVLGSVSFIAAREPGVGVSFFIGLIYAWFFLTRSKGQTPGKALMKIRVIKTDGSPISDSDAILRYIGYLVNNFFLLGWVWGLLDANQQGWHDKLAHTYVINAE